MEGQTTHVSHTTLTKYAEFIMCSNHVTAAVRVLTHTNNMACYQYYSDAWETPPPVAEAGGIISSVCWQQIAQSKQISAKFAQKCRASNVCHLTFCHFWDTFTHKLWTCFGLMPWQISSASQSASDTVFQSRAKWKRCLKYFLWVVTWSRTERLAGGDRGSFLAADREQLWYYSSESTDQQAGVCVCVHLDW